MHGLLRRRVSIFSAKHASFLGILRTLCCLECIGFRHLLRLQAFRFWAEALGRHCPEGPKAAVNLNPKPELFMSLGALGASQPEEGASLCELGEGLAGVVA